MLRVQITPSILSTPLTPPAIASPTQGLHALTRSLFALLSGVCLLSVLEMGCDDDGSRRDEEPALSGVEVEDTAGDTAGETAGDTAGDVAGDVAGDDSEDDEARWRLCR